MLTVPDFWPEFHCIAGACRHTCCEHWEICVDEDSLRYYQSLEGEIGERLRKGIAADEDGAYFALDEHERCPMLNASGLCDLITVCGEDALCDICREHPRFYHDYAGHSEAGLGLCCEEAVRLLLASDKPLAFLHIDDGSRAGTDTTVEKALLAIRDALLELAGRSEVPLGFRCAQMLQAAGGTPDLPERKDEAAFWLTLERMEPEWGTLLESLLREAPDERLTQAQEHDPRWGRLLAYLLYRHLPHALKTGDERAEIVLCYRFLRMLRWLCALPGTDMAEAVRLFSAEIEYSDENVDLLRDAEA